VAAKIDGQEHMLGFIVMAVKTILEGIIFAYQPDCQSTFS